MGRAEFLGDPVDLDGGVRRGDTGVPTRCRGRHGVRGDIGWWNSVERRDLRRALRDQVSELG
jgi:hypothetical protein